MYYVMARKGARKRTIVLWFPDADFLSKTCRLNKRQSQNARGKYTQKGETEHKKDLKSIGLNKYLFPLFRIMTVRTNYLPTAENIYLIIIL